MTCVKERQVNTSVLDQHLGRCTASCGGGETQAAPLLLPVQAQTPGGRRNSTCTRRCPSPHHSGRCPGHTSPSGYSSLDSLPCPTPVPQRRCVLQVPPGVCLNWYVCERRQVCLCDSAWTSTQSPEPLLAGLAQHQQLMSLPRPLGPEGAAAWAGQVVGPALLPRLPGWPCLAPALQALS